MADTTRKYLDLAGLQAFYTQLMTNLKDATKDYSLMTLAEHTKLAGIAEGGQVNVIETINFKGNGDANASALTVTDKAVTIDVSSYALSTEVDAAKTAVLGEEGYTGTVKGAYDLIGTVPAKVGETDTTTVVAYVDAKVASANGAMDTRVQVLETTVGKAADGENEATGLVKAVDDNASAISAMKKDATITTFKGLEDEIAKKQDKIAENTYAAYSYEAKVDTLIGDDADKSVRTIANEELAKQLIPENAQESLDTLAEIAAWIQAHPGDAATMNSQISALETTVGHAATEAVGTEGQEGYKPATEATGLVKDVAELKSVGSTKVEASETNGNIKIDGTETTVYTHATATATDAAFRKIGNDAEGHVVLGDAIAQSDIDAIVAVASDTEIINMMNEVDNPTTGD